MDKIFFRFVITMAVLLALVACSTTKYVPDGEYLLDKVEIESDVPGYNTYDLKPYVRQLPNFKMFNLIKTQLRVYSLSGRDSTKWINRFLKNTGEEPVLFDSVLMRKTETELRNFLTNKGYRDAEVTSSVVRKNKKAKVIYNIVSHEPYRVDAYSEQIEDKGIKEGLDTLKRSSLIKKEMLLDLDVLNQERENITELLRSQGYYDFEKNDIRYEADTTNQNHRADLELILSMPQNESGEKTEIPHQKYYIDKVDIYLDYDPLTYFSVDDYPKQDSISIGRYTFFYQGKKPSIKPQTLLEHNFIDPGMSYSQQRETYTYSSLASLSALSNAHIQYEKKIKVDSTFLDCTILTVPNKRKAISLSIDGTNTAGDLGIATTVGFTHRNLFRGSEMFNLRLRGAYESISNVSNFSNSYLELGVDATLVYPKFVFPFISDNFLRRMRTSTEFSLSYNMQTRPEYDRTLVSGGVSYVWNKRGNANTRHKFDLIDVDYVFLPYIDESFLNSLPSSAQYFGYTDQFIVGMSYSYFRSTFDPKQKRRAIKTTRFSIESAGNMLYGASELFDRKKDDKGSYELFGTYFAQFVKGDFDYARTLIIDRQNSLAFRIGGGIAIPYGNSESLPFEKRYYSGGANSVRGWSVRELGPGRYVPNSSTTFYHQSGDIKLDMNLEYRSRLFWKLETAAFIDAGNIWTIKNYEGQEGGQFKFDTFYKQIALAYGLGIRLDFDFFLVRFDWGWKAFDPSKSGSDAWTILKPNFNDNFAWHIAIGYPF